MIVARSAQWLVLALCALICSYRGSAALAPQSDSLLVRRATIVFAADFYNGKFLKHTPKLTTRTGQPVRGCELGFYFQTQGCRDWEIAHRFPRLGGSILWMAPGDGAHGHLWGLFPHLTLNLWRFRSGGLFFRVGSGIGYASRPYDAFDNPTENALGSHFNNITQFRLGGEAAISRRLSVQGGVELTHFSNGGFELPNFGMNMPGFYCGVNQSLITAPRYRFPPEKVRKRPIQKQWGITASGALARLEYISIDGPKYAIWSISGAFTWKLHRFNRISTGFDLEQNNGVKTWLLNNTLLAADRYLAHKGAQRAGVFVADEFFYGHLGIYLQVGWHVGKYPVNALVISKNYNKLGLRYYGTTLNKQIPVRPFIGVSFKAYKAVAEHIAIQAGLDF